VEIVVATNELERRRWNDERWAAVWPKREALTDAVTAFVLDAAAPLAGERVLDVGCGGGKLTLAAAQAVGAQGAVVGADLSESISALARRRAQEASAGNVTICLLDMQTEKVPGGPFDVVVSQFGVMFFDEPVAAFANIRAQLRPGGRIAFVCWQSMERNPWFVFPAIAAFVPPPPAPEPGKSPTGPFTLADVERTTGILDAAGFTRIRQAAHELVVEVPRDTVVDEGQLVFMGVSNERLADAQAAVDEYMQRFVLSPTLLRVPLAFQVFVAVNP
jgi:SAM-dependent methyltransferase